MAMDFHGYQRDAQRTSNTIRLEDKLYNGIMGLCSEAGECAGLIKKRDYQGHGMNRAQMIHELGDALWYIVEAGAGLGVTLEDIARENIQKLNRRYPEGFDPARSMEHVDGD